MHKYMFLGIKGQALELRLCPKCVDRQNKLSLEIFPTYWIDERERDLNYWKMEQD